MAGGGRTIVQDPYDHASPGGHGRVTNFRQWVNDIRANEQPLAWLQQEFPAVAATVGTVNGLSGVHKFGKNEDIDSGSVPETIWTAGGVYPFQSSTFQLEVLSSDPNDDAGDTGARTLQIQGLRGAGWDQATEDITLDGVTPVTTTITDWIRVSRVFLLTAGSSQVNEGVITARLAGGGATQAQIAVGQGQTQQAIFSTPGGTKSAILSWSAQFLNAGNAGVEVELGLFTKDNSVADPAFRVRSQIGLRSGGASGFLLPFDIPVAILDPMTDVEIRAVFASANNLSIASTFDVCVLDEAVFSL